jgi:hypothetical protein
VALLEEVSYARFVPRDLVRDFARELAAQDESSPPAAERILRWYAESARQSGAALLPPAGVLLDASECNAPPRRARTGSAW